MNLKNIIGENIKKYKLKKGLTSKALAEKLNVAQSSVTMWEKGINQPNATTITKLCNILDITPEMIYDTSFYSSNDNHLFEMADMAEKKLKGTRIPVLGTIPAGIPIEAIQDIVDYEEIPYDMARLGEYFALKIKGDSMSPSILEGDVVIFKKTENEENGSVCAIMVNGNDATIKKIKKTEDGIFLIPNNPSYEPMFFSNKEIIEKPVRIIGKAVEIRRSL